jgi:uncharacterized glyoxalase superfamily protein PhnB
MRIKLTSILVDNQDKALKFYTEIFGFVKKVELPAGEYRWLSHRTGRTISSCRSNLTQSKPTASSQSRAETRVV